MASSLEGLTVPRLVPAWQATAYWERSRCQHCGAHCLALRLWPHARTGDEVTATQCPWLAMPTEVPAGTVVTYDSSVAHCGGATRAGAAAILWGASR